LDGLNELKRTNLRFKGLEMTTSRLTNVNVHSQDVLITPEKLKQVIPVTDKARDTVLSGREQIQNILDGKDNRLIIVVGPCSIHDIKAAKDYAIRLKKLADDVKDTLLIVMRVYFEKPRTTVGWKGLVNDPHMDDSFQIEEGLHIGRQLLVDLAEIGLPTATEALDPISPQYLQELISWSAIGARTTESQTHREMSSGLSVAIGFKNGTDGGLSVAINALQSVSHPHSFLGMNPSGQVAVIRTTGNQYGHIVLRGGGGQTNYDSVSVKACEKRLADASLKQNIMIDTSHANSSKDPALQPVVMADVTSQIVEGNNSIIGLMIESNLEFGNQPIPDDLSELRYGVSVTDGCINWQTTDDSLREMHNQLKGILPNRQRG
jgi:3-deoxy-7-phosphoheptulonate synthase